MFNMKEKGKKDSKDEKRRTDRRVTTSPIKRHRSPFPILVAVNFILFPNECTSVTNEIKSFDIHSATN